MNNSQSQLENLGKQGLDKITGFTGIITSVHFYITGCAQYGLQPRIGADGKVPDKGYFDQGRVLITESTLKSEDVLARENGCDTREHPNRY